MNFKNVLKLFLIAVFFISLTSCDQESIDENSTEENVKKGTDTSDEKKAELSFELNKEANGKYNLEINKAEDATAYYWSIRKNLKKDQIYGVAKPMELSEVTYEPKGFIEDYYLYVKENGIFEELERFAGFTENNPKTVPFLLEEGIYEFVIVVITKEYPNGILITKAFEKNNNQLKELNIESVDKDSNSKSYTLRFITGLEDPSLAYNIKVVVADLKGASYDWVVNGVSYNSDEHFVIWDAENVEFCVTITTEEQPKGVKVCKTFTRTDEEKKELDTLFAKLAREEALKQVDFKGYTKLTYPELGKDIQFEAEEVKDAIAYSWEVSTSYLGEIKIKNPEGTGKDGRILRWSPQIGSTVIFSLIVKTQEYPEGLKISKSYSVTQEGYEFAEEIKKLFNE